MSLLLTAGCAGITSLSNPVSGLPGPTTSPSSSCPSIETVAQAFPGIDRAEPALAPPIGNQIVLGCAYTGGHAGTQESGASVFIFSAQRYNSSDDAAHDYDKLRALDDPCTGTASCTAAKKDEKYARFEDFGDSQYRITVSPGPPGVSTYSGSIKILARNGSYICASRSVLTGDSDAALLGGPSLHRILRKACGLPAKETGTDPPAYGSGGATFDIVPQDHASVSLEWYCRFGDQPLVHAPVTGPVVASCPAGTVLHAKYGKGVDADGFVTELACEVRMPGSDVVVRHDSSECVVAVPAV